MTELTKIFNNRPTSSPNKSKFTFNAMGRFSSPQTNPPSPFRDFQFSPANTLQQKYSPAPTQEFQISSAARQVFTRSENPNLHREVAWFKQKYMLQGLIKIMAAVLISILAYCYLNLVSFSLAISFVAVCSLSLALKHNIFSLSAQPSQIQNNKIESWAFYSLVFSFLVLVNEIFIEVISIVHPETANNLNLNNTPLLLSMLPSIRVSLILGLLFVNNPLVSPTLHRNIVQNIFSIPANILYSLKKIFSIKYIICQSYITIVLITFILANIVYCGGNTGGGYIYNSSDVHQMDISRTNIPTGSIIANNFFNIINLTMNPAVFTAEFLTFIVIFFFFNTVLTSISSAISEILIKINYDENTQFARIPYMLELLRVSPIEDFHKFHSNHNNVSVCIANVFSFYPDHVKRKQQFTYGGDSSILLSRHKTQILYSHCLQWILSSQLAYNPNALQTKISTSKFYNSYSDIVQQFSAKELQRCVLKLNQMQIILRNYQNQKEKKKTLSQDLFFPLKIFSKKVRAWFSGIECLRYLNMVDNIFQILANIKEENIRNVSPMILRSLKELRDLCEEMKKNLLLKQVMREKIEEYFNKSQGTYKKLSASE